MAEKKQRLVQMLPMNGGVGESSYANNSLVQRKAIVMTKNIRDEAITKLYYNKLPLKLAIADLGCSSGPNTLLMVSQLIETVDETCKKLGHKFPECQVFLNDLPENDFNVVFKSLLKFHETITKRLGPKAEQCYFYGVPGSFYGRLFPTKTLQLVHSSYSLHWLSQVPQGLESNKTNICAATTSPSSVIKAYQQQFQRDFSMFLKCRSKELVSGGHMILTWLGRKQDNITSENSTYILELLAMVLNQMVFEGLIEEEKMNSFNIPIYSSSANEIKFEILKEGSFAIDHLEVFEVNWDAYSNRLEEIYNVSDCAGYGVAKNMRAVLEPLLISHFGEGRMDEVFNRYGEIITNHMRKEKTGYINVTISLMKLDDSM